MFFSISLHDQNLQCRTLTTVCGYYVSFLIVLYGVKIKISVSSDERIKKNIQDINDDGALQKILQIEPKTYEYIDKVEKGDGIVYNLESYIGMISIF